MIYYKKAKNGCKIEQSNKTVLWNLASCDAAIGVFTMKFTDLAMILFNGGWAVLETFYSVIDWLIKNERYFSKVSRKFSSFLTIYTAVLVFTLKIYFTFT